VLYNIQIEFGALTKLVKAIKMCLTEMYTIVKSGQVNICLLHFLLTMFGNKEMLYHRCLSTLP
jgi:hypothetical protein